MQSSKRVADIDKAKLNNNNNFNVELYLKQLKEFENRIKWKQ
jgi:hypothetical protein